MIFRDCAGLPALLVCAPAAREHIHNIGKAGRLNIILKRKERKAKERGEGVKRERERKRKGHFCS